MAFTKYQIFIIFTMVISGSINTLSTKWADSQESLGSVRPHLFSHPFLQAFIMFFAEFCCLGVYFFYELYKRKCQDRHEPIKGNPLVCLPASLMDMLATCMLYVALNLTNVSSFQLVQGNVVIFTALLSSAFLRRTLNLFMWIGIIIIAIDGFLVVGIADIIIGVNEKTDRNGLIAGDLLIVAAQIIIASQMVYEEMLIRKYNMSPPLLVGLEGLCGSVVLGVLLVPMYYIHGGVWFHSNPEERIEDVVDAYTQIRNNTTIFLALFLLFISLAVYNLSSVSITKEFSATTRMVIDSFRAVPIWAVSLIVGWEIFFFLQIIGFLLLIFGVFLYFNITIVPLVYKYILKSPVPLEFLRSVSSTNETSPLLNDNDSVNSLLNKANDIT